jgi:hypothetical protein
VGWQNAPVTVHLTASDAGSGVAHTYYTLDGGSQTEGTSVTVAAPADGSNDGAHTITYWSVDNAGNVEAPHTCTVKIDTTAPRTSASGADAAWHNTPVTVSLAATDTGSGVASIQYSTDGGATWTTGDKVVVSAEGETTVDYRATDKAGNTEAVQSVTVKIDTTAPQASASGAIEGAWCRVPVLITLTAADEPGGSGVASITYSLDGMSTTVPGGSAPVSVPASPNAHHTLTFQASDGAGNQSVAQSLSFTIDTTGPVTKAKLTYARANHAVRLPYKATDNLSPKVKGVKVVVKNSHGKTVKTILVSTAKYVNTWYSVSWTPKAKGTYRYYVYAKDLAGNAQSVRGWAKVVVK